MPLDALALALAAAGLHAVWNLLLARAPDVLAATAATVCLSVILFAPVAAVGWRVEGRAAPWIAMSAALEFAYFMLLARAYSRAELSLVYPVARGSAPVLVLLGAVAFGHDPTAAEVAGVAVVAAGVVLVRRGSPRGLPLALLIGATIAAYTLVDNRGIEYAAAVPYLELCMAPVAAAAALTVGGRRLRAAIGPATATAAVASFGAYVLVLLALRLSPAAPVAAVRETSVVIAVVLAGLILREGLTRARVGGAAVVVAGVVLLSVA